MRKKCLFVLVVCGFAFPVLAQQTQSAAPDSSAMEQRMRELEDRVIALEGQIRMLKASQTQPGTTEAAPTPAPVEATGPSQTAPAQAPPAPQTQAAALAGAEQGPSLGGAGGSAAKALNPDISVIGDFIGALGGNSQQNIVSLQPAPAFQMHESE